MGEVLPPANDGILPVPTSQRGDPCCRCSNFTRWGTTSWSKMPLGGTGCFFSKPLSEDGPHTCL